ncbi:MAG: RIP metalloprotease RseP [Clostridiales bacterium]|nr:RIP metalloprotease RseP [Clostridiales bacterium]
MITAIHSLLGNVLPIFIALIVFGSLVTVHEFGHFITAKKAGIFVEEFAIGMGPAIFSKRWGDTVYSLRILPIGGYCRMLGEDEDEADERAFNQKSVPKRMAVIFAGPFMNFLFAFGLIFCLLGMSGFRTTTVTSVAEGYPAAQAGILPGDRIVSINGERVGVFEDIQLILDGNGTNPVDVKVKRGDQTVQFQFVPEYSPQNQGYILGVVSAVKNGPFSNEIEGAPQAGLIETGVYSVNTMWFYLKSTVVGFIRLFQMKISPDELMGPIGIVQVVGDSYTSGLQYGLKDALLNVVNLAAILSVNLGAINLFPIPAMDGGRLLFLIIEGIRRKPMDREKEGIVHFAGFVLLMSFMVFVAYQDVLRIFR